MGTDRLVYHLLKPGPGGRTDLTLTPLELIDRLAALIPPPRLHRHRYNGVLAPNTPLRAALTALAGEPAAQPAVAEPVGGQRPYRSPARYLWAMLVARIYEVLPLVCKHCGAEMQIAFVTETASVTRILEHIGEPAKPPRLSPARGPPTGEESFDQKTPLFDPLAPAPEPAFVETSASPGSAALCDARGGLPRLPPAQPGCHPSSAGPFCFCGLAFRPVYCARP